MIEESKRRNYRIATLGGSFLLPLAGLVGVVLFFAQQDRELALSALAGSLLGTAAWVLLLTA